MDESDVVADRRKSFFRTNKTIGLLFVGVTVVAVILSLLVGLNFLFTVPLLLLFFGVTYGLNHWQSRRRATSGGSGGPNLALTAVLSAVIVAVAIQAVPYGHSHTNAAVVKEPAWPSDHIRSLVVRACYDCHSNEVSYPAYSKIAPISWLIADHVSEGRETLNFSDITRTRKGDDVVEVIEEGSMPPSYFTRFGLHAQAKLTKAEVTELIAALRAMPEFKE